MSKRGISPLIATVLLIGFTVVLAVLVVTWISEVVNTQTEGTTSAIDAQNKCLNSMGDLDASFSGANPYTINIINNGDITFDDVKILWSSPSDSETTNLTSKLLGFSSQSSTTTLIPNIYNSVTLIPVINGIECSSVEISIPGSIPPAGPVCGNGVCEVGETCTSCILDCETYQANCAINYVCSPYDNTGSLNPTCVPQCAGTNIGWCSFQGCPQNGYSEIAQASQTDCLPLGYGECCDPL